MAKAKVFITHPLYPDAQNLLQSCCECEFWGKPERPSREEFVSRLKDKEGLVCLLTERINDDVLRAAPKLRCRAGVSREGGRGSGGQRLPADLRHAPKAARVHGRRKA